MTNDATKPFIQLSGEDGNAWFIIGRARKSARRAGWTPDEVQAFVDEATSGDYDHVLQTVMANFETA